MLVCSYDNRILCDAKYQAEEFYRQMEMALRAGDFFLKVDGTQKCPADEYRCQRFLHARAMLDRQNQH